MRAVIEPVAANRDLHHNNRKQATDSSSRTRAATTTTLAWEFAQPSSRGSGVIHLIHLYNYSRLGIPLWARVCARAIYEALWSLSLSWLDNSAKLDEIGPDIGLYAGLRCCAPGSAPMTCRAPIGNQCAGKWPISPRCGASEKVLVPAMNSSGLCLDSCIQPDPAKRLADLGLSLCWEPQKPLMSAETNKRQCNPVGEHADCSGNSSPWIGAHANLGLSGLVPAIFQ